LGSGAVILSERSKGNKDGKTNFINHQTGIRLEWDFSDKLGKLADNEVVTWQDSPSIPKATATPQPPPTTPMLGKPFEMRWMETVTLVHGGDEGLALPHLQPRD
jgi:hypothetical protein